MTRAPRLGCIADDLTGAAGLASVLERGGLRTAMLVGVPAGPPPDDVDALVVALKSRSAPVDEAVRTSLDALRWLERARCDATYLRCCSTFASTDRGNIGPVADALMTALGAPLAVVCPAHPENGRRVVGGRLYVGDVPLGESAMRDHPLTPMTDSDLVRLLARQSPRRVGLVAHDAVAASEDAVRERLASLARGGTELAVVDASTPEDLARVAAACRGMALLVGSSGLAAAIVRDRPGPRDRERDGPGAVRAAVTGPGAVLAGSCSAATRAQVATAIDAGRPTYFVDPLRLARGEDVAAAALTWAERALASGPVLVYASAPPERVRAVHSALGRARAGALVEGAMARIAQGMVERGVRRLVVAGGETSGAVVRALGVHRLRIARHIGLGVAWSANDGGVPLALALKPGNAGAPDFFLRVWDAVATP